MSITCWIHVIIADWPSRFDTVTSFRKRGGGDELTAATGHNGGDVVSGRRQKVGGGCGCANSLRCDDALRRCYADALGSDDAKSCADAVRCADAMRCSAAM